MAGGWLTWCASRRRAHEWRVRYPKDKMREVSRQTDVRISRSLAGSVGVLPGSHAAAGMGWLVMRGRSLSMNPKWETGSTLSQACASI